MADDGAGLPIVARSKVDFGLCDGWWTCGGQPLLDVGKSGFVQCFECPDVAVVSAAWEGHLLPRSSEFRRHLGCCEELVACLWE